LIQRSIRQDSIVSNFNSTASLRRLFQQHRPAPVIRRVEIPQRSSLLPHRGVLAFLSEAREVPTVKRREFISLFAGVAAAWSVAANAEELAPMEITKPSKATLPQIEVPRVKPVDRMPPNVRLSDDLIDLMKGFSLSSAEGIGSA
jgi:hypothetical protein